MKVFYLLISLTLLFDYYNLLAASRLHDSLHSLNTCYNQLVLNFVKVLLMSFVKIVSNICKIYDASNMRNNDPVYLVADDVCVLYPSIKRETVKMALELALDEQSKFN